MPLTTEQLEGTAIIIRDETVRKANTASRVGIMLLNLIGWVKALPAFDITTLQRGALTTLSNYFVAGGTLGGSVKTVNGVGPDLITGNVVTPQATVIRLNENDPPSPVPATHVINDIWINANSGAEFQLDAQRIYQRLGSLKGRAGSNALYGYADDANGTNPSTSPVGKKWRAEYTGATPEETFTASKAQGLWVPFSIAGISGLLAGNVVNMNVDYQTAPDFTGAWTVDTFSNVYLGASCRITRRSLNSTYVTATTLATVTALDTGYVSLNGNTPATMKAGGLVRISGQVRRSIGMTTSNYFYVESFFPSVITNAAWEYINPDTLVLPTTQATINSVLQANNIIINQYGTFIEGFVNTLRFECVGITGTTTKVYEFDLFISN